MHFQLSAVSLNFEEITRATTALLGASPPGPSTVMHELAAIERSARTSVGGEPRSIFSRTG